MLSKRIIPCLDIKNGRVVKCVNFINLVDSGDPIELAQRYCQEGADELVFLDIVATFENRQTTIDLVSKLAKYINIPFTIGGGISTVEQAKILLNTGADKVSINSSAIKNPDFIRELSHEFGSQAVVVAIDTKLNIDTKIHQVYTHGGRNSTGLDTLNWAKQVAQLGAGEILLTSMDADGTKQGFDLEITKAVCEAVNISVIASGGAGTMQDFTKVLEYTQCDAVLGASVFHTSQISIPSLKQFLQPNFNIRKT